MCVCVCVCVCVYDWREGEASVNNTRGGIIICMRKRVRERESSHGTSEAGIGKPLLDNNVLIVFFSHRYANANCHTNAEEKIRF